VNCTLPTLKGSAIIEIGPAIANSMVDIIFDGNGKNVKNNDELTNSEKFVMGKLIVRSFDGLRESWKKIIEFNPELVTIETIASTVEISPPETMGALVSFECKIDDVEDMMSIYYPHRVIEPIKNQQPRLKRRGMLVPRGMDCMLLIPYYKCMN
jgi:flagellar motor switch protein FliM